MKQHIILPLIAGLILPACVSKEADPVQDVNGEGVLHATIENPSSRTFVDEDLCVVWHDDDRISVFRQNPDNCEYCLQGEGGVYLGDFIPLPGGSVIHGDNTLTITNTYAVYPFRADTRMTGDGEIMLTLPSEQAYRENSFGKGANTMISAYESIYALYFKNLCGYLTVRLFGENVSVSSISLRGNNAEPLAGQAKVTALLGVAPSISFDGSAAQEITIRPDSPVLLGDSAENATTFWFVIPPVTFSRGITLTVTDDHGGQFVKSASSGFTIERNLLSSMSPLRVGPAVPGEVTAVSLDKKELTLFVGETFNLTATVHPEDAADKTVTWASSDTNVATVDANGCVSALSNGVVTITAKAGGMTARCKVTVNDHQENDLIVFADEKLKKQLVLRFDRNGDRELSYAEAAAVTTLEGAVVGNDIKAITSFDELRFFTGITDIPEGFFSAWTSLSSITFPPSIGTLHQRICTDCPALTSVVFSEGTKLIKYRAFYKCPMLSYVVLPKTLVEIETEVFYQCKSLSTIHLPDKLKTIGEYAFYETGLKSILIPGKVSIIGENVFTKCADLASVVLSDGVKTIAPRAFQNCESLVSIDFGTTVEEIGYSAFDGCKSLKEVVLPSGIKTISHNAFQSCSALVSVMLPDHLTEIGNSAFSGCESLPSLNLPSSVTSIGSAAFSGCRSLIKIVIPAGTTSLGGRLFSGCNSLSTLIVESGNPVYDSRGNCNAVIQSQTNELLMGCKGTVIPDNVLRIGNNAFSNNTSIETIAIPQSVTSIGDMAFSGSSLTTLHIPGSVQEIGSSAFVNCKQLSSLTLSEGLERICSNAFLRCQSLTTLHIPGSVSEIGPYAFQDCTNLSTLTFSEGLEYIGTDVFVRCQSLTALHLPSTVKEIGPSAFYGCTGMAYVRIDAEVPPKGGNYMFDWTKDCPIYVPAGSVELYKSDPYWKSYASRIGPIEP